MDPRKDSLENLAWQLDEAFQIPGTRFRFGWDAIVGLIPGIGETVMVFTQAGIVLMAVAKYDLPPVIVARMVWNVVVDGVVGSIPFIGDIFDFFFKANTKNLQLIRQAQREQATRGRISRTRHYLFFALIAVIMLAVVAGVLALVFFVGRALLDLIGGPDYPTYSL